MSLGAVLAPKCDDGAFTQDGGTGNRIRDLALFGTVVVASARKRRTVACVTLRYWTDRLRLARRGGTAGLRLSIQRLLGWLWTKAGYQEDAKSSRWAKTASACGNLHSGASAEVVVAIRVVR